MTKGTVFALPLLATIALAEIQEDGLWTGHDWEDDFYGIGVDNGIPYATDSWEVARMIDSPRPLPGSVPDYLDQPNVQRVLEIIDAEDWAYLFPKRNAVYTFDGFLNAVGKFPAFCGENGREDEMDEYEMCARELATVFAHFVQETSYNSLWEVTHHGIDFFRQGLHYIELIGCEGGDPSNSNCDWYDLGWANDAWPVQDGKQYYARGPFQLAWNYNYGRFSNVFHTEGGYSSFMYLLEHPEEVSTDGYTVFSSALWFYMTPQSPKPSMHDIVTGFFVPNAADQAAGITGGFGTTINVINGGAECGWASSSAAKRGEWYLAFLDYFGLPAEGDLGCATEGGFPAGGAGGLVPGYFT
jgi:chitodextrinase